MKILYFNLKKMTVKHVGIVFFITSIFFWYTMVYSSFYKNLDIKYVGVSGKSMYLGSKELSKTIVVFDAKEDISDYTIHSLCQSKTEFLYTMASKNFFSFQINDGDCKNEYFYLQDAEGNILSNTRFRLYIISDFDLYNKFSDYTDMLLSQASEKLVTQAKKLKLFASIDENNPNFEYVQKLRVYDESLYQNQKIEEILLKRQNKYKIPVEGYSLPDGKNISKFPNGGRPYRANYTNAVHEGWDIDAPNNTPVISIDDGIVLKVVRDFSFGDLKKIQKKESLSAQDKLINLDILRGNQVWIKTMKGDVIFYAHLSSVDPEIEVGKKVERGQYIGNTGITGVPDEDYKDYHLHFELRKNPYSKSKAGKNTELDYMGWDRYFKGETLKNILDKQYKIFEQ